MPKGYWIGRVEVTDAEMYKAYTEANAKPFKLFGAKFLVRAGRFENPEARCGTGNRSSSWHQPPNRSRMVRHDSAKKWTSSSSL